MINPPDDLHEPQPLPITVPIVNVDWPPFTPEPEQVRLLEDALDVLIAELTLVRIEQRRLSPGYLTWPLRYLDAHYQNRGRCLIEYDHRTGTWRAGAFHDTPYEPLPRQTILAAIDRLNAGD